MPLVTHHDLDTTAVETVTPPKPSLRVRIRAFLARVEEAFAPLVDDTHHWVEPSFLDRANGVGVPREPR